VKHFFIVAAALNKFDQAVRDIEAEGLAKNWPPPAASVDSAIFS
jgi:hypothetical protein